MIEYKRTGFSRKYAGYTVGSSHCFLRLGRKEISMAILIMQCARI